MNKLLSSATKASILLASSGSYICQDKKWVRVPSEIPDSTHTPQGLTGYGMRGEGSEWRGTGREGRGGEGRKTRVMYGWKSEKWHISVSDVLSFYMTLWMPLYTYIGASEEAIHQVQRGPYIYIYVHTYNVPIELFEEISASTQCMSNFATYKPVTKDPTATLQRRSLRRLNHISESLYNRLHCSFQIFFDVVSLSTKVPTDLNIQVAQQRHLDNTSLTGRTSLTTMKSPLCLNFAWMPLFWLS